MKKNLFVIGIGFLLIGASIFSACEGPMGPAGADGKNGTNGAIGASGATGAAGTTGAAGATGATGATGADGTATCIQCHNPAVVELAAIQYELSKHGYGEAAFLEAGNVTCSPCHTTQAFVYVSKNNIPATFTLSGTTYVNNYRTIASQSLGNISCATCHSSIHTTYSNGDFSPLTTVAPVSMTMWGGNKEINLPADGGQSNLCVKCHQPRPFVNAMTTNVVDYVELTTNPTGSAYDGTSESPNTTDKTRPGYRTHPHYGTAGAVYAGKGGVEFPGTLAYTNSFHTNAASCQDCHMGVQAGRAGGHTFNAVGKFDGCNESGCHTGLTASSSPFWTTPRADVKKGLDDLAAKLKIGGVDILNRNPDAVSNLWVLNTTNKYDGYLNVYDPINNPGGIASNSGGTFKATGNTSSWTQAQRDINATLPVITLTNAQLGAIINFQMCLRDYSLGIHNYKYTMALLTNSLAILP